MIAIFLLFLSFELSSGLDTFRFASHYADHMVLQRHPLSSVIWGFAEEGAHVAVKVEDDTYYVQAKKDWRGLNVWKAYLEKYAAGGPYKITASSIVGNQYETISLDDVYFGDVWLCGGQSNMVFTVNMSSTAEEEETLADYYPMIRLFTVQRYFTNKTMPEIPQDKILQQWSVASKDSVGGPTWQYFSSVCWMYGRRLFDRYQVPIGLISTNYGGTCVEAWSSPETLAKCGNGGYEKLPSQTLKNQEAFMTSDYSLNDQNSNSALWNGMIYPLLNTTIYGAIWYQGEQNAVYRTNYYNCTFPAMIKGWRREWFAGTFSTNPKFPFGFVQLASLSKNDDVQPKFPVIRWKQTAEYGSVPNEQQENVFMAVAYDLPDSGSPFGSIHPRDKDTVAHRLFLGAQAVAYGDDKTYWSGPIFSSLERTDKGIVVYFIAIGNEKLLLRSKDGFEIHVTGTSDWIPVKISSAGYNSVFIETEYAQQATEIRYNWKQDPCLYKFCAIYSSENELPAPPFIAKFYDN